MTNNPLISICIPTYNGEKYLKECLESVSMQEYKNIEVIIADNLSTDCTLDIANAWKSEQSFPVHIYSNPNKGIGKNWNFAIKKSKGEYLKLLFQDDLMKPDCLSELMSYTKYNNDEYKFISCKRELLIESESNISEYLTKYRNLQKKLPQDINGNYIISNKMFKNDYIYKEPINFVGEPSVTLIHKDIFKNSGLFDENLKQIIDYEFYFRVLKKNKILIINKELAIFRVHGDQTSQINNDKKVYEYFFNNAFFYNYFFYISNERKLKFFAGFLQKKAPGLMKKIYTLYYKWFKI